MAEQVDQNILSAVLDDRERRWNRRMELSQKCDTLVSITLCLPLRYRSLDDWKTILRRRTDEVEQRLQKAGFPVTGREEIDGADGLCLYLLSAGGEKLKRFCISLEEELPGGRFLDIDLTEETPISRRDLGLQPRKCFVCGASAADCVAVRRHSKKEIDKAVETALSMTDL